MPAQLRIFVSHSSKDNDFTGEVRDALIAGNGGGLDLEPLVDLVTLEGGRPWPLQLHEMMADAHAALILLTTRAVASEWVLKEATILTWRQSLEPGFKAFVVQDPDVTDAQIAAAKFGPLQHRLLQGVAGADAASIAARVRAELLRDAVKTDDTLFERLVRTVSEMLQGLSDAKLRTLVDKLEAPPTPWRPASGARAALLEGIAARILRGELGRYTLSELMDELKASTLSSEILRRILRFVAPHWVSVEAAARLGDLIEVRDGKKTCRPAALNGRYAREYTGQMYVDRAFPLVSRYRVCRPTPAAAGNQKDDYAAKICDFCRQRDKFREAQLYEGKSDDAIVDLLKRREPWLFVVLPSSIDPKEFEKLRETFPHVFFVLATGDTLDPSPHEPVVRLEPPLSIATEEDQYLKYFDAVDTL